MPLHPSLSSDTAGDELTAKPRSALDLGAIRAKLAERQGRHYWRSLEEVAGTEEFAAFLHAEFPQQAEQWSDGVGRRQFLKLMGASLALAGVSACTRQPAEKIYPYVKAPEEIVPGEPLFFATAMPVMGFASGVLVESHLGRPTKIEGNPEHPASLGATDAFAQASVLTLYDPDRSQVVRNVAEIRPWSAFVDVMQRVRAAQADRRGAGLRILTETVTSPSLAAQLRAVLAEFPAAQWHQYEPLGRDNARMGTRVVFGIDLDTQYLIEKADVILALDADFLSTGPAHVRHVREFSRRRRVRARGDAMNRLYVAEPTPTNTGAMADHRLPLRATQIEELALAVAKGINLPVRDPVGMEPYAKWIDALVKELNQHRGSSIVMAGDGQPPFVHGLVHAINHALANQGSTVVHTAAAEPEPVEHAASLKTLVDDMERGAVEVLIVLGGNPVYTAPPELHLRAALAKVPLRIHLGLYEDETAELCHWHVPEAHYLESWGDVRAYDGTVSILQPLIAPLYGGKTALEVLATLSDQPGRTPYDLVRAQWQRVHIGGDFEPWWRKAVHDGVVADTAFEAEDVTVLGDWPDFLRRLPAAPPVDENAGPLEIVFRPDAAVLDGRFANNAWLQELPRPLTRLTWDNAALVSPATAERLGLANEDVVELHYVGQMVRAPIWIAPGHADDVVSVSLGYGRTRAGAVGTGTGFDAYALRTTAPQWFGKGLELRKTGEHFPLACTQHHHSMEGRELVRSASLAEYRAEPGFAADHGEHASMYPPHPYDGHAWGMAIDLNACVGCNACVVACQSENNIPVVGKREVAIGREMHWIRIDRYYEGALDNPATHHRPVLCMHCEQAPCEVVCPVNATVHSHEGLNDMVYNRCVGTRYCSNNCPYKVRRFNFRLYTKWETESLKMLANPDVTVRSRGVMEKCTYCVQRINGARIAAKKEDRPIRDGEIVTACQAVCPAEAITFGDINDPQSRVAQLKANERHYALLGELGTRPRTTYLASLRNPNPELA